MHGRHSNRCAGRIAIGVRSLWGMLSRAVGLVFLAACAAEPAPRVAHPLPQIAPPPIATAPVVRAPPPDAGPPAPIAFGPGAWTNIHFVDVTDAFGPHTSLVSDLGHVATGMRLVLTARGPTTDVLAAAKVRVHVAASAPVAIARDPIQGIGNWRGGPRTVWSTTFTIPWSGAPLDEAFVEVDVGADRYWLEVPYGFAAGPATTAASTDPRTTPKRAPAMASLGAHDRWVPFRDVAYDLGVIQNGWRLFARLSNPFDAHAELELYRDDIKIGQSAFLWKLGDPVTSAAIFEAAGATLASMPMQLRLHEDGMRRSDDFHFDRSGPCTRAVGTFRATVGETTVVVAIPSSLYGYTHGTADPYDTHRVVGADGVLGAGLF